MRAYEFDAGADLYSRDELLIEPGEGRKISTGIAVNIPPGYYGHIHTRSSMAKQGFVVLGGIVDSSYKGELFVILRNLSNTTHYILKQQRIAQLVLYPIVTPKIIEVSDIGTSERGDKGFGSTNK